MTAEQTLRFFAHHASHVMHEVARGKDFPAVYFGWVYMGLDYALKGDDRSADEIVASINKQYPGMVEKVGFSL